jgi:hypothetical protein
VAPRHTRQFVVIALTPSSVLILGQQIAEPHDRTATTSPGTICVGPNTPIVPACSPPTRYGATTRSTRQRATPVSEPIAAVRSVERR